MSKGRNFVRHGAYPARWLWQVLEHAQKALAGNTEITPVEQMYHFHWINSPHPTPTPPGGAWRVSVPSQQASAGRVSYRGGNEASIVLDLHRHHAMPAYFSPVDNGDEQGCRFYAVIGKIYDRPEIRLRLGVYGDFIELEPLFLFEGLGPFTEAK